LTYDFLTQLHAADAVPTAARLLHRDSATFTFVTCV
jgi:hypothetical protein